MNKTYWDAYAREFDAIYTHRKSRVGAWLDRTFRKDMYQRFEFAMCEAEPIAGRTFLDVGCGTGVYAAALAERGARRVVGLDYSAEMLKIAAARAATVAAAAAREEPCPSRHCEKPCNEAISPPGHREEPCPSRHCEEPGDEAISRGQHGIATAGPAGLAMTKNAAEGTPEFVCAEFMEYAPAEAFDVVLAMGFMDYVADPLPVLKKMRALARDKVILSFPRAGTPRAALRRLRLRAKSWPKPGAASGSDDLEAKSGSGDRPVPCHVYFYSEQGLWALFKEAGFNRDIRIVRIGQLYCTIIA